MPTSMLLGCMQCAASATFAAVVAAAAAAAAWPMIIKANYLL